MLAAAERSQMTEYLIPLVALIALALYWLFDVWLAQ